MKIGIDARMIEHSGIGTRIAHVIKYLQINPSNHQYFLFGNPDKLENYITNVKQFQIVPYLVPIYHYKEWFGHPMMGEMDILDIPHFNVPIVYLKKCLCQLLFIPLIWYLIELLKNAEGIDVYDYDTKFNPFSIDNVYEFNSLKKCETNKTGGNVALDLNLNS